MYKSDVIVIGAGAAGMMCAWQAALRGRSVRVIEHTRKIGEKIRISGGGKSNFTNLYCSADNFISENPHFCKSALKRFSQHDFIAMIEEHDIPYHEKPHNEDAPMNSRGQLFCDKSAGDIVDMLKFGILNAEGNFQTDTSVKDVQKNGDEFVVRTNNGIYSCESLVVASGGLSIPKIGASKFGYQLAKKFGLEIVPPRAGLVPLTFGDDLLEKTKPLSGSSIDANVSCGSASFREGLLFTHRGLSGPSILQASSYWREGEEISVDLAPDINIFDGLKNARKNYPKQMLRTVLSEILPNKVAAVTADLSGYDTRIADLSDDKLRSVADFVNSWKIKPNGTEGYRTAEVTLGGVDTDGISSKTFEAKTTKGLYFIGEVLDVTGHLGGHNFQWAWSSGWCAGQVV